MKAWAVAKFAGLLLFFFVGVWIPVGNVAAAAVGVPGIPAAGSSSEIAADELPSDLTREEARDLLARLSDAEVRELLVRFLDQLAGQRENAGGDAMAATIQLETDAARERLRSMLTAFPRLQTVFSFLADRLSEGRSPSAPWLVLLVLVLIAGIGFAGEWVFGRFLVKTSRLYSGMVPQSVLGKCGLCMMGAVLDALRIVVFGLFALGVYLLFYQGHEATRMVVTAFILGLVQIRLAMLMGRVIFAPHDPVFRMLPISDDLAAALYRMATTIVGVLIFGHLFIELLHRLGIEDDLWQLFGTLFGLVVTGSMVVVIWAARQWVSALILGRHSDEGDGPSRLHQLFAGNWHILASVYLIGTWLLATFKKLATGESVVTPAIVTLVIFAAIPAADWLVRRGLTRLLSSDEPSTEAGDNETSEAKPPAESARGDYLSVIQRNARVLLILIAVIFLARVWGIDFQALAAEGVGRNIAGSLLTIVVTLIVASAIWGIVKTAINRNLPDPAAEAAEGGESEAGGQGGTRLETLLPLFRKFLFITLIVIVSMTILSSLGVDIGPLIAGAGMVGIAVGFGAQTLVRDIVSGVFFLVDDAFRIGEYIVIGDVRGMVEGISVRSLRLRHHNGPVHTVPFGEIAHLTNYSRDWVIMKLEVRVPFETDIEKVRKLVKKVGQNLMEDEVHGPNFLQPLKSQGVNRMDDSAFIIRVKFMAKPGEQFVLRREVFRRIQEAFAENNIQFAPRRVIVDGPPALAGVAAAVAGDEPEGTESGGDQHQL